MPAAQAVRVRSWCRVDLAGGTLDIWPLGLLHAGASTINLAIDLAVEVRVARRAESYRVAQAGRTLSAATPHALREEPDGALVGLVLGELAVPPVEVEIRSGSPRGGGLGASSALVVALIVAVEELAGGPSSSVEHRVGLARDLEARLMSLPTGTQDHYPGLLGGALEVRHRPGGAAVRQLETDLERLGDSLLIAYTGESHFSAGANWTVVRRRLEQDPEVIALFEGISGAACKLATALEAGDLARAGAAMSEEWSFRRRLAPGISVPAIETLLEVAMVRGAWGGKACGAGGGGCVAVLCPPERRAAVEAALVAAGGAMIAARPTRRRLEVSLEPRAPVPV